MRPYNFYWWEELNFGQESVFFKNLYFLSICILNFFPKKLFSNY